MLHENTSMAQCFCSKGRIEKVIQSFPLKDRMDIALDGEIKVIREFCNALIGFQLKGQQQRVGKVYTVCEVF
ncbi:Hsp33 family molecular chaperone HslO [Candidatus Finniella inopinata]|uniref:Uncharacterized protein n=1 Tax=Candidatus Finniella inopinata TaxID=1696036 RepID=A0A4Q7DKW1_9PROT|nr:Hsp33 family molecular chaperone HslO [Candidatus Finniella inopinata]RZI47038.1 hypothetical protein EQU50_00170 [Candidatus Finniella inopinata]